MFQTTNQMVYNYIANNMGYNMGKHQKSPNSALPSDAPDGDFPTETCRFHPKSLRFFGCEKWGWYRTNVPMTD